MVWQTVSIDEAEVGFFLTSSYGCLMRWCQAHGRHIQDLRIFIAESSLDGYDAGYSPAEEVSRLD